MHETKTPHEKHHNMKELSNVEEAIQYIQVNLKAPKGKNNAFGNFKYRSCADVLEAVKPLLKETGAFILLDDTITQVADRIYVKATAKLVYKGNEIQSSALARERTTKAGMDEAQITGAASSYARKYALAGLLAIDDSKNDPDMMDNRDEGTNHINEADKSFAILKAKKSTNRQELSAIWKEHKTLQQDEDFIVAVKERGVELKNVTKQNS